MAIRGGSIATPVVDERSGAGVHDGIWGGIHGLRWVGLCVAGQLHWQGSAESSKGENCEELHGEYVNEWTQKHVLQR